MVFGAFPLGYIHSVASHIVIQRQWNKIGGFSVHLRHIPHDEIKKKKQNS